MKVCVKVKEHDIILCEGEGRSLKEGEGRGGGGGRREERIVNISGNK